jgi:hypothetical protein
MGRPAHAAAHRRFVSHLTYNAALAIGLLLFSLFVGMLGYHALGPMPWLDAFVNAAMLLSGMGPVAPLSNDDVKLFAGLYALYCGVMFIASIGLLLAPVAAHILRRFHLDEGK